MTHFSGQVYDGSMSSPPKKKHGLMSKSLVPPKQERLGISDKFFVLASDAIQMVVMEIVTWAVRSLSSGVYIYILTRRRGGGFKVFTRNID